MCGVVGGCVVLGGGCGVSGLMLGEGFCVVGVGV